MHKLSMRIRSALNDCVFEENKRNTFIAFALAQSLATALALPTTPVASIGAYYNDLHASNVNAMLSEFNEHFVVNLLEAQDLIKKCYAFRYKMVFEPSLEVSIEFMTAMYAVSNEQLPPVLKDMQAANIGRPDFLALLSLIRDFRAEWSNGLEVDKIVVGG